MELSSNTVQVHDLGYVRLVDHMGSDLNPVNAARASFMKESKKLDKYDTKLLKFLHREGHDSPFRHAVVSFEIKAPLMVARQWFKYRIGCEHGTDTAELIGLDLPDMYFGNGDDSGFGDSMYARNEASRRYVTLEPEFYRPDEWRSKPDNSKQGSGASVHDIVAEQADNRLLHMIVQGMEYYDWALENNICAEQARLFLPAYGLYTVWRWQASLQAVIHFLQQRLGDDAQKEIQSYAAAVRALTQPLFPETFKLYFGEMETPGTLDEIPR